MILKKVDNKYVALHCFQEKHILKEAGFWWNPDMKHWWTKDIQGVKKVLSLTGYRDAAFLSVLSDDENKMRKADIESRAVSTDINIPAPEGLEYMPFQKAGIKYAIQRKGCLIADQMGLGKTISALGIINYLNLINSALIICPATLKLNWKKEAEKWLLLPYEIEIVSSRKPFPDADIVIINYDILGKFHKEIHERRWDILICDEAHYLKNEKSQRTIEVLGKRTNFVFTSKPIDAGRKVYLTGTPILNRPIEIWPLLSSLDGDYWKSRRAFQNRYCTIDGKGGRNLEELQTKLRRSIMVRRLKEDVLAELPAKTRQVIEIAPDPKIEKELRRLESEFKAKKDLIIELKTRVELAKVSEKKEDYVRAVNDLKTGVTAAFTEIAALRHRTAVAKAPYILLHLQNIEHKVVVFAHHKAVIEFLQNSLGKNRCVILTGEMTSEQKQASVDRFQTDPECLFFIGSIKAAGVGITLTASSHVVFAELDWVPGNVSQAEDRCHRIGQKDSVLVQHFVFERSLDAVMAHTLVDKQEIIDKTLDSEVQLRENDTPIVPAPSSVTEKTSWDEFTKDKALPQDEHNAVHEALRIVAGYCDGASQRDGEGFNLLDTRIEKELAKREALTWKQALLGKRIVMKYHKQLPDTLRAVIMK